MTVWMRKATSADGRRRSPTRARVVGRTNGGVLECPRRREARIPSFRRKPRSSERDTPPVQFRFFNPPPRVDSESNNTVRGFRPPLSPASVEPAVAAHLATMAAMAQDAPPYTFVAKNGRVAWDTVLSFNVQPFFDGSNVSPRDLEALDEVARRVEEARIEPEPNVPADEMAARLAQLATVLQLSAVPGHAPRRGSSPPSAPSPRSHPLAAPPSFSDPHPPPLHPPLPAGPPSRGSEEGRGARHDGRADRGDGAARRSLRRPPRAGGKRGSRARRGSRTSSLSHGSGTGCAQGSARPREGGGAGGERGWTRRRARPVKRRMT